MQWETWRDDMTTFNIALGSKVPGGITIDLDMTNETAVAYLVEYGIKQSLNDAIAAIKTTDADYTIANTKAIVEKRWNAILTGTVRQAGTREASDPYAAETRRLALATFKALDDQVRKVAMTRLMKAGMNEKGAKAHIVALYMADAGIIADAKANVDAMRAKAATLATDIDLASLFAPETDDDAFDDESDDDATDEE